MLSILFNQPSGPTPPPGPGLPISASQAALITSTKPDIHSALLYGVVDSGSNPVLNPIQQYNGITADRQATTESQALISMAVLLKGLGIGSSLPTPVSPGIVTVYIAQLEPAGLIGSMTFQNGVLIAKVDPT